MRPQLLLLDEPPASLDAAEVKRIATTIVRVDAGRVTGTGGPEILDTANPSALA